MSIPGGGGKLCRHCGTAVVVDHGDPDDCIKALRHEIEVAKAGVAADRGMSADEIPPVTNATADALARRLGASYRVIIMVAQEPNPATGYFAVYRGGGLGVLGLLEAGGAIIKKQLLANQVETPAPPKEPPASIAS